MYIRRIEINNIRSIEYFEMTFPKGKEAGWHVLIGDNGSGKSTIMRSAALALLDYGDISATRQNWNDWLKKDKQSGNIVLDIFPQKRYDSGDQEVIMNKVSFRKANDFHEDVEIDEIMFHGITRYNYLKAEINSDNGTHSQSKRRRLWDGWFSASYGPFRRFTGGDRQKEEALELSNPKLIAHLSIFGEDVALSGALTYLRELYLDSIDTSDENSGQAEVIIDLINGFVNFSNLLPNNAKIERVTKDGIFIKDGNGFSVSVLQMSDGYRAILSLVIDLLRHILRAYGIDDFYDSYTKNRKIDLPGVVLIDEVDAHLHPTWQTRIGQWFTQYFPNIQFIVTTHSPLVCRAAEKGSIWRLAAPGSRQLSGEITGLDRDRLIYGNILDAYGTEVFGPDIERSDESNEKLQRLAHLSQLNAYGKLSEEGKKEMNDLRKILITDDITEF